MATFRLQHWYIKFELNETPWDLMAILFKRFLGIEATICPLCLTVNLCFVYPME